ncbi:hypothetical protein [Allobranchiibius sp. CTAmp26]|uniref:hypothetical protein n=1 Tax=Allobranchiibius sp. CTAmp26 TaxID=2815214 RepID=UPI001AA18672|nr:hypothetical protein [Allobranchiibius sp. CTAmp26]MBO1755487.1 hypothetical protein [Allobranchiibius sp. CTAmp26]
MTAQPIADAPDTAKTGPDTGRLDRWKALGPLRMPEQSPALSATSRARVAALCAVAVVLAQIVHALGPHDLGSASVWFLLQILPGAAVCVWWRGLGASTFALYSIVLSLVIDTLPSLTMALTGSWHPDVLYAVVGTAMVASFAAFAWSERDALRGRPGIARSAGRPALLLGLCAVGLVLVEAGVRPGVLPPRAGITGVTHWWWYLGIAVLLATFAYACATRDVLAAPVLLGSTVVVLSQALAYRSPNVMPAARHIGVIKYLFSHHQLDPSLDIYQAWSGFFASQAWTMHAAGITDPFTVATWWPVLGTVAVVLSVRVLAGKFLSVGRAWVAAGIFALGNSLAIDYFSPQAVVLAPCFGMIALLIAPEYEARRLRTARYVAAIGMSMTIAVSHQISPYMATGALIALILARVIRPWWTFLIGLVPALVWALLNQGQLGGYLDPGAVANFFENVAPPQHPSAAVPVPLVARLTYDVPAVALVMLVGVAAYALFTRRDRHAVAIALAGVSPAGLALATNYGQEGIFRMALFALPWIAILAASASAPRLFRAIRPRPVVVFAAAFTTAAVLMAVNVLGQTGMDWARIMRPGTVVTERYFELHAPRGAAMLSVGTKAATPVAQTGRYLEFNFTSLDDLVPRTESPYSLQTGRAYDPRADIARWTRLFIAVPAPAHYALLSDDIGAFDERYGNQLDSDYTKMRKAMRNEAGWRLVVASRTAELYRYVGAGAKA